MYKIYSSQKVHSFTNTPIITLVVIHLQNQSVDDLLDMNTNTIANAKRIQIQMQTTIVNANTQKESGLVVGRGSCPHGQDLNQEYPASCCILQPKLSHSQNFHTAETLDVV